MRCRSVTVARLTPRRPPRSAIQTAEPETNAATCETSRAGKSRPAAPRQIAATPESKPTRPSMQGNHKARLDAAILPCQPQYQNGCVRVRSRWGKRVLLLIADRKASIRIGHTVGNKPGTLCRDERNRSRDPKAPALHWYPGEQSAKLGVAAISDSRGNFAIVDQEVYPTSSADRLSPQVPQAMKSHHRLRKNPPGQARRRRD